MHQPHQNPSPPASDPLEPLTLALTALPGVNRRAAAKIAFRAAAAPQYAELAAVLRRWTDCAQRCQVCRNLTDRPVCAACALEPSPQRLCVVADAADAWAIARAAVWPGGYHVLERTVDPAAGVMFADLDLEPLLARLRPWQGSPLAETLLALPNTALGNLTAQGLAAVVADLDIAVTVLNRGVASGAQIRSQAPATIRAALENRTGAEI